MINTAPPAWNIVYVRLKNGFQNMCVTVVQWSRSCLHSQINRVRLPATLFSVCLYRFYYYFFLFSLGFSFSPVNLYSYCGPRWSCTWINIYFKLKSGVLFWKRNFKSSWSAYWPSLRPEKNTSCRLMSPLLSNSCIFFNVSWHHDKKKHTVHQKTVLVYTQHSPVIHWRNLDLPFVHRLNYQYITLKSPLGLAP